MINVIVQWDNGGQETFVAVRAPTVLSNDGFVLIDTGAGGFVLVSPYRARFILYVAQEKSI